MQTLKKLPLFIGMFLVVIWGASKKMNLQNENSSTVDQLQTNVTQMNNISNLLTSNGEDFYANTRPLLPQLISDEELHYFLMVVLLLKSPFKL